jgi:hypothetical protein
MDNVQQWHYARNRQKHFNIHKVIEVGLCSSMNLVIWGWGYVQLHLYYQSFIL